MADTPEDITPEDFGSFRGLYHLMGDYEGTDLFADVLRPSIPCATRLMEPLRPYRKRQSIPALPDEEDWEFFALSVVNDLLRSPLMVSEREYLHFFEALGFSPFRVEEPFNPIRHEITRVSNFTGKSEEGIRVSNGSWPGLMFGDLVFSRAATVVRCHSSHRLIEGIADRSTLYDTYSRFNRPTYSPSHGWGSNSRWRTSFRFDYDEPEQLLFNAYGHSVDDLADPSRVEPQLTGSHFPELSLEWRRELLIHRCFVTYDHPGLFKDIGGDWSIYNGDYIALRRADVLWPLSESLLIRWSEVKPPVP